MEIRKKHDKKARPSLVEKKRHRPTLRKVRAQFGRPVKGMGGAFFAFRPTKKAKFRNAATGATGFFRCFFGGAFGAFFSVFFNAFFKRKNATTTQFGQKKYPVCAPSCISSALGSVLFSALAFETGAYEKPRSRATSPKNKSISDSAPPAKSSRKGRMLLRRKSRFAPRSLRADHAR